MESAEAYALNGLIAKLADRHFILARDDAEALLGHLEYDLNPVNIPDDPLPNKMKARQADDLADIFTLPRRRLERRKRGSVSHVEERDTGEDEDVA